MNLNKRIFNFFVEDLVKRNYFFVFSTIIYGILINNFLNSSIKYFGPCNLEIWKTTIIMAFLCAIYGYSYCFSAKKTRFYLSLPLKRKTIFLISYINGVLTYVVPLLITYSILGIVIIKEKNLSVMEFTNFFVWGVLLTYIGFILFYNLTILVIEITGNYKTFLIVVLASVYYVHFIINKLALPYYQLLFDNFYKLPILEKISDFLEPIKLYKNLVMLDSYQNIGNGYFKYEIKFILFAIFINIILFLLLLKLNDVRKIEQIEKPFIKNNHEFFFKLIIIIPASLKINYFVLYYFDKNYILGFCGSLISMIFINFILSIFLSEKLVSILKDKKILILSSFIGIIIITFLNIFKINFDCYIPKINEINNISICINGLDSINSYNSSYLNNEFIVEDTLNNVQLDGQAMIDVYSWILTNLIENKKIKKENELSQCSVIYVLKNGKKVYRRYSIFTIQQIVDFNNIYILAPNTKKNFGSMTK